MTDANYSVCKMFMHTDKIQNYLNKDVHGPISVELHPTNRCNYNCKWCEPHLFGRINRTEEMSKERLLSLVDELKDCDVRGVLISGGGEPLLHPNIPEFIEKCYKNGISIGLFTNGSLITRENIPSLMRCDFIRISFDAGFEDTYNKLKGCKSYKQVIENIRELVLFRNEPCVQPKPTIGTSYVASKENISNKPCDIDKYIGLMNKLGVDYAQIRPVRSETAPLTKKEFNKLKKLVEWYYPAYKDLKNWNTKIIFNPHYNTAYTDTKRTYDFCHMTDFQVVIAPNGDMYPCYGFIHKQDKCIGNIKDNFCKEWRNREININCKKECVECRFHLQNKMLDDLKKIQHKNFM